ncbi:hypothetical protein P0R36_03525, partial [Aeromonas caviae]|uniref:hypothetical protein n=1 Tax=Aeromonas caviae TaxID=648 RepID=UPI0023D9DF57
KKTANTKPIDHHKPKPLNISNIKTNLFMSCGGLCQKARCAIPVVEIFQQKKKRAFRQKMS